MNGKLGWYKKNDTTINYGTYVGEIKNGKPNGFGTKTYQYDLGKYEGEWKNGEMHGQGTHYKFGTVSKGEFRKNLHICDSSTFGYASSSQPHTFFIMANSYRLASNVLGS